VSNPSADLRTPVPAPSVAVRATRRAPGITMVSVLLILALVAAEAARRGPWLDEFWALELSDYHNGLWSLIRDGWLHDVHPPVFNAWTTLLAWLGITSIAEGRLTSNLLAAGLMLLAARRLILRRLEQAGFTACFLLLALSLPRAMEAFAIYRSYFWQIAAMATLALVARHLASERRDLDLRQDVDLAAIAVVATTASMTLHYVSALFGGLLAGAIALHAFNRGLVRWAGLIALVAASSTLFVGLMLLLQAPHWSAELDHNWNDIPPLTALGVPLALATSAVCANPVPLLGLLRRSRNAEERGGERAFALMIGTVLVLGTAAILAVHLFRPVVVDRYLFAVPVLVAALLAVPAARFAADRRLFGLLALVSVAVPAVTMLSSGGQPFWRENAQTIAKIVANCPATQVYAASGWALGPAAETHAARREDPVFERAYRLLADEYGYPVRFISQGEKVQLAAGPCPVLLWFEHTPNEAEDDLPAAIEAAGLGGLQHARLSAIRSATGFVVQATPATRDGGSEAEIADRPTSGSAAPSAAR